jgi:phage recombination protein Bet
MTLPMVADAQPRALAMAEDELIPVLRSSLYPGAKDESIKLVIGYCRAAGLDPLQKPVHIVPMLVATGKKNDRGYDDKEWRDVVMPGIGLYRVQAARTGALAGIDEPEFGGDVPMPGVPGQTVPEWCRVTVYRLIGPLRVAFTAREYWAENYATKGRDSAAPNAMWQRRPRGQLAKCAEAQALRKAFPELGSQPTADETVIDPADVIDAATDAGPASFTVGRKAPAAPATAAQVVDVEPTAPAAAPAPAPTAAPAAAPAAPAAAPAAPATEGMVGPGEVAYLQNKAKTANVSLVDLAAQLGGLVIEAGKLSKADFDRIKAELRSREG